jgi:ankyrin repeat protein
MVGNTALIEAVNMNNAEIVRLLIDNLADVTRANHSDTTALELARVYDVFSDITQMLADAPAHQARIIHKRAETKRLGEMHERTVSKQQLLQQKAQARRIKLAGL